MRALGWSTTIAALVAAAAAGGCRGRGASDADAQNRPAAGSVPTARGPVTLAAGTPAGGLRDWTREVRSGLSEVPSLAVKDVTAAQKTALELYLTRQEYIEMYWGTSGKLTRGGALGPAVKEAETRFHLILSQLQPGHAADEGALRKSVAALGEQYDAVISAAERAAAPLDPHAVLRPERSTRTPAASASSR